MPCLGGERGAKGSFPALFFPTYIRLPVSGECLVISCVDLGLPDWTEGREVGGVGSHHLRGGV